MTALSGILKSLFPYRSRDDEEPYVRNEERIRAEYDAAVCRAGTSEDRIKVLEVAVADLKRQVRLLDERTRTEQDDMATDSEVEQVKAWLKQRGC